MSAVSANEIVTYWLIPAEPARSYFRSLITDLAARFDAPVFEPHVTIQVTNRGPENPAEVLAHAATGPHSHRLFVQGIDFSDEFTKTLFVQFQPDAAIPKLSKKLQSGSVRQYEYQLNPHLSLLYKELSRKTKTHLAQSLSLPFAEVVFDSIQAVISPASIQTREDVEAWRVVATKRLAA